MSAEITISKEKQTIWILCLKFRSIQLIPYSFHLSHVALSFFKIAIKKLGLLPN